jgi:hypothetical protein
MDIKAVFPSVGRGRLIHRMSGKGMDGNCMQWTASLRTDRTVAIGIEGNLMVRGLVEAGVPRGDPVSPILFAIYSSQLIK